MNKYNEPSFKLIILTCLMLFGVISCANISSVKEPPKDISGNDYHINYIDSSVFDSQFTQLLTGEANSVSVEVMGDISINNIPERLNSWLENSTMNGSTVTMVDSRDVEKDRGLPGKVLQLIYEYYKEYQSNIKYEYAGHYDIELIYNKETGSIKNINYKFRDDIEY
ncbi:MAG: hypothetical protein DIZ80_08135 [endosymbiont of Galathealinum brachiosum]|uniref:Uncharacterized protein n=1 Tax=endosymbiont of Galathealinum brachiosum TaxID=2200906 RepID=A0A370DGT3_9GAMM|nr:MAG: hypothetical protein DIZ80_08135 [endosymbiont of Galathealinum brachiosum]